MTDHLNPEDIRIGATIRALAEAHGWTVGTLAAALERSHSNISNILAGRRPANASFCRTFADLLGVPLAAIVSSEAYERAVQAEATAEELAKAGAR